MAFPRAIAAGATRHLRATNLVEVTNFVRSSSFAATTNLPSRLIHTDAGVDALSPHSGPCKSLWNLEGHASSPAEKFSPAKHLSRDILTGRCGATYSLQSLGFGHQLACDFGISDSFPLLSEEGLRAVRKELSSKEVIDSCMRSSDVAPLVLRDTTRVSKFLNDLWASSEIEGFLSKVSGIPLAPHPMQKERGHVNVQDGAVRDKPVFPWHFDSQPFVCIVTLHDVAAEQKNNTLFKDAQGGIHSVEVPAAGYAVLLQGSVVEHCAPASEHERCTMITSYVPRDSQLFDSDKTNLCLARSYDDKEALTHQFFEYRLKAIERRCADLRTASMSGAISDNKLCDEIDRLSNYLLHSRNVLADPVEVH